MECGVCQEEWLTPAKVSAQPSSGGDPSFSLLSFVVREFMEEALDSIETGSKKVNSHTFKFKSFQVNQLRATVEDFFADGHELYRGYVQVGS